jgi:hypothetical protein
MYSEKKDSRGEDKVRSPSSSPYTRTAYFSPLWRAKGRGGLGVPQARVQPRRGTLWRRRIAAPAWRCANAALHCRHESGFGHVRASPAARTPATAAPGHGSVGLGDPSARKDSGMPSAGPRHGRIRSALVARMRWGRLDAGWIRALAARRRSEALAGRGARPPERRDPTRPVTP